MWVLMETIWRCVQQPYSPSHTCTWVLRLGVGVVGGVLLRRHTSSLTHRENPVAKPCGEIGTNCYEVSCFNAFSRPKGPLDQDPAELVIDPHKLPRATSTCRITHTQPASRSPSRHINPKHCVARGQHEFHLPTPSQVCMQPPAQSHILTSTPNTLTLRCATPSPHPS